MRNLFTLFILLGVLLSSATAQEYMPGKLIVKVKQEHREACKKSGILLDELQVLNEKYGVEAYRQKFPRSLRPSADRSPVINPFRSKMVDISLIYEVSFDSKTALPKILEDFDKTNLFEYVEPWYVPKVMLVPNDNRLDTMWHLGVIRAFEAWDIDTGDSDITIAIVDTGVDWDHPDIADVILINPLEIENNGVDDDSNGFIDDVRGWNFFDDNNDPNETGWSHGTHVAGLSGAVANNSIGVAGTSFGCSILAIKSGDKLELPYGYDGIVYAADMGADIINCSWGGAASSEFGLDIVRYATYNRQALIVAGAGNDNRQNRFYPASYIEVVSVASSDTVDHKSDFSNYNYQIDIIAPGTNIFSLKNDTYGFDSGTSMSAPIVAGAAALIKHRFPNLLPLQIMAQLKATSDKSIYQLSANQDYEGKLGAGRLDMYAALDTVSTPGVTMEYFEVSDGDDEVFLPGETLEIGIELVNYLNPTGNLSVELTSLNEHVSVTKSTWNAGALPTHGRANNITNPFEIELGDDLERNEEVDLRFDISDGQYSISLYRTVSVYPDYVNVRVNDIKTTVSKDGLVAYTDFFHTAGLGFQLDTHGNLVYEIGLMIGHELLDADRVVDKVRSSRGSDHDFWPKEIIDRKTPEANEAFLAKGSFVDSSAIADEIGLKISTQTVAFDDEGHENYILQTYTVHNKSGDDLFDVYVGMMADWDINDYSTNKAKTAYGKRLGYVYSNTSEDITGGIQLISNLPFHSYMIDNVQGGAGGINLYDEEGFSSRRKFITLSNDRLEAGKDGQGNDVIQVISAGPMFIARGDSQEVTFALHAARNRDAALLSADSAYRRYHGFEFGENIIAPIQVRSLSPNPTSDFMVFQYDLKSDSELSFVLLDIHGRELEVLLEENVLAGYNQTVLQLPDLHTGVYFIKVISVDFIRTLPFEYLRR